MRERCCRCEWPRRRTRRRRRARARRASQRAGVLSSWPPPVVQQAPKRRRTARITSVQAGYHGRLGAAPMDVLFPPFRLDLAGERLWRETHEVRLRPKTFAVLRYLAERPGRPVSISELLDAVWPGVA